MRVILRMSMQSRFFMGRGRVRLVFIAILLLTQVTIASDHKEFISIADIHFSPFVGCEQLARPCIIVSQLRKENYQRWAQVLSKYNIKNPIRYYQDTNYSLLKLTLLELQKVNQQEHPYFVLILGDFLAHDFRKKYIQYSGDSSFTGYQQFVKKTLQFLTYQIEQIFPKIDIYPAIGNNDSYTGDYEIVTKGKFFRETATTWDEFIKNKTNLENFRHSFPVAGYYAVILPTHGSLRLVMLNTVLFSAKIKENNVKEAAKKELAWLKSQLALAEVQHQSVLIAFHIPFGIDGYSTIMSLFETIMPFWRPETSQEFAAILKQFPTTIVGILPAHIHTDIFRLVVLKQGIDIPVTFTPSISPIFGNNPGIKVFSYDDSTSRLSGFNTYFYALNSLKWGKVYSFSNIYQPDAHQCHLMNKTNHSPFSYYWCEEKV